MCLASLMAVMFCNMSLTQAQPPQKVTAYQPLRQHCKDVVGKLHAGTLAHRPHQFEWEMVFTDFQTTDHSKSKG